MNPAVAQMLSRYPPDGPADYTRGLREIMQEIALLGLWRSKFFDGAAFYGETALRILHGLDRFSEDLDFSLLEPRPDFDFGRYSASLERELRAFGFAVEVSVKPATRTGAVCSAFLKADTLRELLTIEAGPDLLREVPEGKKVKIKLEVDTDPPGGFRTETRFLFQPVPFAVRVYDTPDLFAAKMHALLFRTWRGRVKGRDWYDFVWFAAAAPRLHVAHLEQRMRQSGHWSGEHQLTSGDVMSRIEQTIGTLDVERARREVGPFVADPRSLEMWSRDLFRQAARMIEFV